MENPNVAAEPTNVTTLPAVQTRKPTEVRVVQDAVPILDTARFEHMQRIANVMARSSLVPDSLRGKSTEEAIANCFLVVNQAVRWNMDPFAVAQCAFVVHGKLGYEGKLVAAVVEARIGNLDYEYFGEAGKPSRGIVVRGKRADGKVVEIKGTVAAWKTSNDSWKKDEDAMLVYRGARHWARVHAPSLMLGVYTPDELEDLGHESRAQRAIDVTHALEPPLPPAEPEQVPQPPEPPAAAEAEDDLPLSLDRTSSFPRRVKALLEAIQKRADDCKDLSALAELDVDQKKLTVGLAIDYREAAQKIIEDRKLILAPPENAEGGEPPAFDETQWLNDLAGALAGATDANQALEIRRRVMVPQRGKVSADTWAQADQAYEARLDDLAQEG